MFLALLAGLLVVTLVTLWPGDSQNVIAEVDSTSPTVSSIAITSDPDDDDSRWARRYDEGVYGIGDDIEVTVTFSEDVIVTGSPRLELSVGGSSKTAAYDSATSSKVVFSYNVATGDSDTDGISISANKLTLNGGTIKDEADNDADLTHSALPAQSDAKVDGIRPTITGTPSISGSSDGSDGVYTSGEIIVSGLRFSEEVIAIGAQPLTVMQRMKLNVGGTIRYANFGWASPACTQFFCVFSPGPFDWRGVRLAYEYTVVKGDLDLDGVSIPANSMSLNGGTIKDAAGNDAVLTHSAAGADSSIVVDAVPATISSIAITSDPGSDNTYGVGDSIEVKVTFSESVRVPQWHGANGIQMPRVELNIGDVARVAKTHERSTITGTSVVFSYTVQDGDNDPNGVSIGANKLTLNGGSIEDNVGDSGGEDANISHGALADASGHKVATSSSPPKSNDATLSALTLSGVDFGTFDSTTISYTSQVASSVTQTTVTPTVNHSGASYVIKLGGVTDADGTVSLAAGNNVLTIEVTAEDGQTTRTYTVTVTRLQNAPATGAPTISGTAEVGETLTASTSDIADTDGLTNVSYSYQWVRNDGSSDTDIQDETGSTYTVTPADAAKSIKVRATFTDDTDNEESVLSDATARVPAIWAGSVTVGNGPVGSGATGYSVFSSGMGSITTPDFELDGVTNTVQIVASNQSGFHLGLSKELSNPFMLHVGAASFQSTDASTQDGATSFLYTWSDPNLSWGEGDNLHVVLLEVAANTAATGVPTISGTVQVGETLTASTAGVSDADGLDNAVYSYQWIRNDGTDDSDISEATNGTYALADADEGRTIKVKVSFTDDAGYEETLTSAATEAVEPAATGPEEPTDRPHGLTATASENAITLTWQEPDNFYGPDYHILRHRPEEGEPKPLIYVDFTETDATTFTDTDVEPGVLYVYQVRATIDLFATLGEPSDPIEARVLERETSDTQQASNTLATGVPTISGTVLVGETLTASASGIADADGLTSVSYSYQWIRNDGATDADISGATSSTYTLADADEGTTIKVKVSFTDDAGHEETLTSAATAAVEPAATGPKEPTDRPHGLTATASENAITLTWQEPDNFYGPGYHILRHRPEGEPKPLVYVLTVATTFTDTDVEPSVLYVYQVRASIDAFSSLGEPSDPIEVRMPEEPGGDTPLEPNSPATGAPTISGTVLVGETLTADTSDISDSDGFTNVSFSYQWVRNDGTSDTDISGATSSTYTLVDSDEGNTIKVRVSFTDDAGNEETLTSAATGEVVAAPSPLTVSLENSPASHNGTDVFTFQIRFSEELKLSYKALRDHVFTVDGGTVKRAKRQTKGSNIGWTITVEPDSNAAVRIVLPTTSDCDATGAICTEDGRKLSNSLDFTVSGPG